MFTPAEATTHSKSRKHTADEVHRSLMRFPMIVDILGVLGRAQVPFPGDAEIRHGCERALTAMLLELARIEPAPDGKPVKTEETVTNMLEDKNVGRLMDADQLQRIQQFVERILGPHPRHH